MVKALTIANFTAEDDTFILQHPEWTATLLSDAFLDSFGKRKYSPSKITMRRRELARQAENRHPKSNLVIRVPESKKARLANPIHLPATDLLGLWDLHAPFHDAAWVNRCMAIARSWSVGTLVLGGDFTDGTVFGKFGHAPDDTLEDELEAAEALFDAFTHTFDHVVVFPGNHESNRILKTLEMQLNIHRYLRLFTHAENVDVTAFEWITMDGFGDDYPWLLAHGSNSSVVAGRVPSLMASRQWTEHHVVSGHGHLVAACRTEDGKRWAIDSGMCADRARLAYTMLRANTRPRMCQGAVIVKAGHPYLLTPDMDDAALTRMYEVAGEPDLAVAA